MAPAEAAAERAAAVRAAAHAWARAGRGDEATAAAIADRYPDDRVRLPPGLRTLAFVLAALAVLAAFAFVLTVGPDGGRWGLVAATGVFAALCAAGTEWQRGPARRADAGAEAATALLAAAFAGIALFAAGDRPEVPTAVPLGAAAVLAGLMAARWGGVLLAALAAVLAFVALAQTGLARLLWIVLAVAALGPLLAGRRHGALAPSQRACCTVAAAFALAALLVAVNLVSWDRAWVEDLRFASGARGTVPLPAGGRVVAMVATGLVPVILLAAGARRRDLLLVLAGAAGLAAAGATVRYYHPVLPLPYALGLIGAALITTAVALRRWLAAGPGGERGGWTAEPLLPDDRRTEWVRVAVGAVTLGPGARPEAPAERTGGGRFGGGGAGGSY